MTRVVYLNGLFLPAAEARVSVFDRGFLYGDSVFETLRAYHGRVFAANEHFQRLARSAAAVGINLPFDGAGCAHILDGCLGENRLTDAILRLCVSRGQGVVPNPQGSGPPTVVAFTRPPPDPCLWETGIGAIVSTVRATPPEVLDPGIKSGNFLSHTLAIAEAGARGADEAILLNDRGQVAEGAVSNLFGVWDGILKTPPEDAHILPGITRGLVLELARENGLKVSEAPLSVDDLARAEELFVSNAGWEVMPVTALAGKPVAEGRPGPLTQAILSAYRARVHSVCGP